MTTCTLCDLSESDPITAEGVDGEFCCRGCLEVYRTLGDVEPEADAIREELGGEDNSDSSALGDDGEHAYLAVDGMHCGTCEAFVEASATSAEGVTSAEASYASDTVRVKYDPESVDPDELPSLVSGLGYRAKPREERSLAPERDDVLVVRALIGGGFFGMMVMLWYVLFLYPTYFGYESVVDLGGMDGLYLFANIWLMSSIVLFYTGYPLLRGAYVSFRTRQPNMDLLVALAATGAYAYSTVAMLVGRTDLYFDVTVAVVLVVTAGTYYESRIKRRAAGLLSELTTMRVEEARRRDGETVALSAIEPGEELLVRPGERVPIDGTVIEGRAAVDEALVTGESLPATKGVGDDVRGGTVVTDAPLVIEVGEDAESTLDRLVELLWSIQSARPGVQRLADRLATIFVPLVLVLSAVTTTGLLLTGSGTTAALLVGLTVLIVSCPCSLGLATPLAVARGLADAADRGIVVADETLFEAAPDADVIAFDKTGTLTSGEMSVEWTETDDDIEQRELIRTAAAIEEQSSHPVAEAIVGAASADELPSGADSSRPDDQANPTADDVEIHPRGVSGSVDGQSVVVGHPSLFTERGWTVSDSVERAIERARVDASIPVVVGWDGSARGVIAVGDRPRDGWQAVVETLSERAEIVVLTGDEGASADRFERADGVSEVFAGVPPEAKAETIRRLGSRGMVAMVGDGSNDAPALAAADVGIALGGGTELATDAADAVLVDDDLRSVPATFSLARGTNRRIKGNVAWAFAYNAVAIPAAIAGLLNPLLAAAAMAASSLFVVANSSRPIGNGSESDRNGNGNGEVADPDHSQDGSGIAELAPDSDSVSRS